MFYFRRREQARAFAALNPKYKLIDFGPNAPYFRRWAVKVIFKGEK